MELWALLWIHKLIRSPVRYSSLRLRSCSLSLLGRTAHGIWTQAQGILFFNYWIKCPFLTCSKLCQNTHEVWTGKGGKGVGGNKMVPPFTLHYRHPWTNLDVNCPLFTWFSSPSFPFNFPIHVGELAGITATCCGKKNFCFLSVGSDTPHGFHQSLYSCLCALQDEEWELFQCTLDNTK